MSTTILRLPAVLARVGLKKTAIYEGVSAGTFPAPVQLSEKAVGWRGSDIDAWIASRVSAREVKKPPEFRPTA